MAFTATQFLQSLLQSITAYYTATYSSDTDLYELLSMYGAELASGSTALETVRNNLFVTVCENSKLHDNFGTYFQQAKYFEQNYDEDRYVSGSGTFKYTTPAQYTVSGSTAHVYTGAGVSGSTIQWATIPSYRKQLDFMLEAAMNGSTLYGMTRAVNAFTLVNPDIRELYDLPQWKLKTFDDSVVQLSTNVWQFTGTSWRVGLWAGAHATFSGSAPIDKVAAGYVVMVNDNNTITVGPIYDNNLLFDFRRP